MSNIDHDLQKARDYSDRLILALQGPSSQPCNGWANWDTWSVFTVLYNDEGLYNQAINLNADQLAAFWDKHLATDDPRIDGDFVNWDEIKENLD